MMQDTEDSDVALKTRHDRGCYHDEPVLPVQATLASASLNTELEVCSCTA